MADVLSQSEVESLLAALDPAAQQEQPAAALMRQEFGGAPITVYDFKRPERVSKEQMRAFHALHEGFSREFGAAMSGMLRTIVECKMISADQLTYSEFVFSLENPTCLNLLYSKGLDGHIILDLNPSIAFPIVDRLLGGGKAPKHPIPTRPLTEIELRIISRITGLAIRGLEKSWRNICQLDLEVMQVESNPQLVQIVPPNEVIVLISFEITMGELKGIMNLCIPFNTIEPLSGKLSSDTWSSYNKRTADTRQKLSLETGIQRSAVNLVVQFADSQLTAREVMNLAVGDVIMTENSTQQGVRILVEGRPMFEGHPGVLKGYKAIRIRSSISHPEQLVEQRIRNEPKPAENRKPADLKK